MKVIGITGRSGAGKSSVTGWIAAQGYPIVDADLIAREVLQPGSPCLPLLQKKFGADILDEAGELRRHLLADRAFQTPEGTKALTDITFPEIFARIKAAQSKAQKSGEKLFFVDGAVIVNTPVQAECSALILVYVPQEIAVRRISARDGISPEMAQRRLDAQLPLETLQAAATYQICNDGTLEQLEQKTKEILADLCR